MRQQYRLRHGEIWALKLTNEGGLTCMCPANKLRVGHVVHAIGRVLRRVRRRPMACTDTAVHAYARVRQMRRYDREHCRHGRRGLVWLVALKLWGRNCPQRADKLIGVSYRVVAKVGRRGDRNLVAEIRQLRLGRAGSRLTRVYVRKSAK